MTPEAKLDILHYCQDVLHPRALQLEAVQRASIPFRPLRWLRAYREHKQTNATWRALLDLACAA